MFKLTDSDRLNHALERAMPSLSFNEKATMYMKMCGLNNVEIAERLQVSKMAITKILRRCGRKLQPHMETFGNGF